MLYFSNEIKIWRTYDYGLCIIHNDIMFLWRSGESVQMFLVVYIC